MIKFVFIIPSMVNLDIIGEESIGNGIQEFQKFTVGDIFHCNDKLLDKIGWRCLQNDFIIQIRLRTF